MYIKEVSTKAEEQLFLEVPLLIYKDIKEWIRPLDQDINKVFDPSKNKFFRHGKAIRWLLMDDNENPIGRVAAFVNNRTAKKNPQPTGGMGFFECINDESAAYMLFKACVDWNSSQGMEAMDGPINFGERDRFWGLLVDGFFEPVYAMNYNPLYYQKLFESFGFRLYFNQFCYSLKPQDTIESKYEMAFQKLKANPEYEIRNIKKSKLKVFARDFSSIYNQAWAKHGGGKEISPEMALKLFQTMKPVMDERIIWFVYHKNEPIAMWINLPELNFYFKRFNGKFGIVEKIKFLWLQKFATNDKYYGLVFGIVPSHQGIGVDGYMIRNGQDQINQETGYKYMELQWIGDFNPKMISIAKSLGTKQCRNLITYRYMFDNQAPYDRMRIL